MPAWLAYDRLTSHASISQKSSLSVIGANPDEGNLTRSILGITMLTLVVYTRLPIGRSFKINARAFVPIGGTAGFGSSFLGIPGPMASLFYLQFGLVSSAYVGTSAIGLGLIQIPKLIIFSAVGLLTTRVIVLGLYSA